MKKKFTKHALLSVFFLLTMSLTFQVAAKSKNGKANSKGVNSQTETISHKEKEAQAAALSGEIEASQQPPVMSINEDETTPLNDTQSETSGLEVKSEEAKRFLATVPKIKSEAKSLAVDSSLSRNGEATTEAAAQTSTLTSTDPANIAASITNNVTTNQAGDEVITDSASLEPENETPVFKNAKVAASLNAPSKTESSPMPKLLATLGILLIVLFSAWTFLKRYAKRTQKSSDPLKVRILSQHFLSPKRSLVVVQIAGETILLGATDHNINILKSLSLLDEEIPDHVPQNFDSTLHQHRRDGEADDSDSDLSREARDTFALSGLSDVRDRVSRKLSEMRNL